MVAFLIGAGGMALGGIAKLILGVKAEGEKLEDIAKPLTAAEAEEGGPDADEAISRDEQAAEDADPTERRWRERDERRRARDRGGRRRYRPGPGSGQAFYSPGMLGTAGSTRQASQRRLDREIDELAAVLEGSSPLRREELARRVGAPAGARGGSGARWRRRSWRAGSGGSRGRPTAPPAFSENSCAGQVYRTSI